MRKKWAERNKDRIEETLEILGREKETELEPEEAQEEVAGHQIVTYYHKRVGGNEPTGGQALYFVCRVDRQKNQVTLMDALLNTFTMSRRAFEEGLVHVYWPEEQRTDVSGVHCDAVKYAASMERQAKSFASAGRTFDQMLVRRSIAELRGTTLDKIPKFKTKEKQGEKVMAEYMKRAKQLAEEWDESEEQDEDETPKSKKSKLSTKKPVTKSARKTESEDEDVKVSKSKKSTKSSKKSTKSSKKSNGTRSASEHATPKSGTVYEATFKGKTYSMKVVKDSEGEIAYRVGKNVYKSPSAAGKAVIGGACNGWRFWKID